MHAGVEGQETAATGGVESVINQSAVDLLRRLPGVTEANFRPLMAAAGSLAGLADMAQAVACSRPGLTACMRCSPINQRIMPVAWPELHAWNLLQTSDHALEPC